jgi:hypothetical protein
MSDNTQTLTTELLALANRIRERCSGEGSAAMLVPGRYAQVLDDAAHRLHDLTQFRDAAMPQIDDARRFITLCSLSLDRRPEGDVLADKLNKCKSLDAIREAIDSVTRD